MLYLKILWELSHFIEMQTTARIIMLVEEKVLSSSKLYPQLDAVSFRIKGRKEKLL